MIYDELGLLDKAIKEYKEVQEIDRKNKESFIRLDSAYEKKGIPDKTIRKFNKVAKYDANDGTANLNFGLLMIKDGKLDDAATFFEEIHKD